MAQITIRVGASRDASLATVFQPLEQASKRAKQKLSDDAAGTSTSAKKSAGARVDYEEKRFQELAREAAKWERQMARDAEKAERDKVKAANATAREKAKLIAQEARDFSKAEAEKTRAAEKATKLARASASGAMTLDVGGTLLGHAKAGAQVAGQVGRTALNFGKRAALSTLSGEGADLSYQSLVSKNTALEASATHIANAGYLPGTEGPNGQRQDVGAIQHEIMSVSKDTATDTSATSEALESFIGLTGDLDTGRKILKDMAVLAKATGSDLGDMGAAAANIATHFEGMPDKAERTLDVLKALSAQGKVGAVEISDMATQMAKVAAASGKFSGDPSRNMKIFAMLAQESRKGGGSASATQAATSVGSFAGTFAKGARLDAFQKFGVNVQGKEDGTLADPTAVITDAIRAAATKNGGMKSFNRNMGDMFKDVRARSVTQGFETIFTKKYNSTNGSEEEKLNAGIAAVQSEMDDLSGATMATTEEMESFRLAMGTSGSKATEFSLQLQEGAANVQKAIDTVLYPAIGKIAEAFNTFAGDMASKGNADAVNALVSSGNVQSAADLALKTGTITPDLQEALTKAAADQKAAIANQQAETTETTSEQWTRRGLSVAAPLGLNWLDKTVGGSGKLQSDYAAAEQQNHASAQVNVDKLVEAQTQLNATMKAVADHLKNGTLKVTDTTSRPPPAGVVDPAGRVPGTPGATPRAAGQ